MDDSDAGPRLAAYRFQGQKPVVGNELRSLSRVVKPLALVSRPSLVDVKLLLFRNVGRSRVISILSNDLDSHED